MFPPNFSINIVKRFQNKCSTTFTRTVQFFQCDNYLFIHVVLLDLTLSRNDPQGKILINNQSS